MCPQNNTDSSNKSISIGLILLFLGFIFLLNSLDLVSFRLTHIIFSFPFILLVIGILIMLNSSKKVLGGIFAGIGLIWLLPRMFYWIDYGPDIIVPIALIGLGIYIIFKHTQKKTLAEDGTYRELKIDKDVIEDVAIFGGGTKIITSDNFKGGSIVAIFGGSEIDLTNSKMAEGYNVIDILTIFGGSTLIIPKDWNVQVNITPIFGGFSNKTIKAPSIPIDLSRTLVIKGIAIFGGGEVKSVY